MVLVAQITNTEPGMPVILALKMLCQEDHELGVSLDYIARACLKPNQINRQASK